MITAMSQPKVFDPTKESLYHIAGSVPDPSAMEPEKLGMQSSLDMTKSALAHPLIRWRDRVVEADLYLIDDRLVLHLICPKCSTAEVPHALYIREEQKAIDWRPETGELSVERFECTWELPEGRRMEFGIGMCRWRVAIDKNLAKDV